MDNKLQEWKAPRLMRLNQADGTNKHLDLTEGQFGGSAGTLTAAYCQPATFTGNGGQVVAGAACGPS